MQSIDISRSLFESTRISLISAALLVGTMLLAVNGTAQQARNWQQPGSTPKSPGMVEHAGMSFVRIPMTTGDRPSDASVKQFLAIVNDPAKQPVYVHCQGGQHRTGVMTAVYRMTKYAWTEDKAYDEMKQYKFETFFGHPELRQFVHDFYSTLKPAATPIIATILPVASN